MKKILCLLVCLGSVTATLAQQATTPPPTTPPPARPAEGDSKLTRFNLDFPGGTAGELAAAIQKGLGRPVNVIIPSEHVNVRLPAMKMSGVTVPDLLRALSASGTSSQVVRFPNGTSQVMQTQVGFNAGNIPQAQLSDDTVWYFYVNNNGYSPEFSKIARFHLLTPYLEAGLTVDDITTAIRTAWKMRGEASIPALSFHQETKLLIAVGEPGTLSTVDDVLRALDPVRGAKPAAPAAAKAEERKAER